MKESILMGKWVAIACVGVCCFVSVLFGAAMAMEYSARASECSLRAIDASHRMEREDWQQTDQALATAVVAQHKQLLACRQGYGDAAAREFDAVEQIQADLDREAVERGQPAEPAPAPTPQPVPIAQGIFTKLARLIL